jgi:hypothetical protein
VLKKADLWFRWNGKQVNFVVNGRGLTLHLTGGVSVTGLPSRGCTSLIWGSLKRRCECADGKQGTAKPVQLGPTNRIEEATVRTLGPLMLRVGRAS